MMMYQLLDTDNLAVLRVVGNTVVPTTDPDYLTWVAAGNAPAPSTLDAARAEVWERIKEHREAVKIGGVQVDGHWYHTDADSRLQQLALRDAGDALPQGIHWQTLSGVVVEMTPALAEQLRLAPYLRDLQAHAVAKAHRAAMELAPDPREYDFSAGWPESYGDVS
jgi:hypothetical protein